MKRVTFTHKMPLKKDLLEFLYGPAKEYLKEQLRDIIRQNNLHNGDTEIYGELIYKGHFHAVRDPTYMGKYTYYTSYELHPNLVESMDIYLANRWDIAAEQANTDRFITRLLNEVNAAEDMQNILGDNLWQPIKNYSRYFAGPLLSDTALEKIDHSGYVTIMQNRAVNNIISGDLYRHDC